jgi:hypothetical protein
MRQIFALKTRNLCKPLLMKWNITLPSIYIYKSQNYLKFYLQNNNNIQVTHNYELRNYKNSSVMKLNTLQEYYITTAKIHQKNTRHEINSRKKLNHYFMETVYIAIKNI